MSAATKTVWVSALSPSDIFVISPATDKIVRTLSLPSPDHPGAMALPPGNLMFVADYDQGGYFTTLKTYAVSSEIKGCGSQPLFIAYDPSDGLLYALLPRISVHRFGILLHHHNPKNDAVTDVTLGSGASQLRNVAINPVNGYAYIF